MICLIPWKFPRQFSLFITFLDTGRTPLGMGNGFIKDSQITATSRFLGPNDKTWKGSTGRLRVTANRWCSAQPLNYQDWLQVDFRRNVTITGIATQGDDNHQANYVKQFYLQVSFDGTMFANVTNKFCEVQVRRIYAHRHHHIIVISLAPSSSWSWS